MTLRHRVLICAVVGCAPLWACQAFNECAFEPGPVLGEVALDLDLRERVVRTQEAPIGNLVADALFEAATEACATGDVPCPDLALQNAGGIRQETSCGSRDELPTGPVVARDLADLLPFENDIAVVELTGRDLKLAFERSVAALGQPGTASEAGHFLQVSRARIHVSCAGAAQSLSADQSAILGGGERVRELFVNDVLVEEDAAYQVATNTFIATGNDGFLAFLFRDDDGEVVTGADGEPVQRFDAASDVARLAGQALTDRGAVARFLRESEDAVGRPPEGRLVIDADCY